MDTDKISRSDLKREFETTPYNDYDDLLRTERLIDDAQPVQMWTPCSKKQPESDGVYHVTVTFNGKSVTRDQVFHEGRWLPLGKLLVNGVSGEPEVIAWMEKPAPYQAPVLDLQQSGFGRA